MKGRMISMGIAAIIGFLICVGTIGLVAAGIMPHQNQQYLDLPEEVKALKSGDKVYIREKGDTTFLEVYHGYQDQSRNQFIYIIR